MSDGTFTLNRDPSHPTGKVLCVKGKEAPAITFHPDRLQHPMKRTNAKGSADPGWQRITWDEARHTEIGHRALQAAGYDPFELRNRLTGSKHPGSAARSEERADLE